MTAERKTSLPLLYVIEDTMTADSSDGEVPFLSKHIEKYVLQCRHIWMIDTIAVICYCIIVLNIYQHKEGQQ